MPRSLDMRILAVALSVVALLTAASVRRNTVYETPVAFSREVLENRPGSRQPHHNYAIALLDEGARTGAVLLIWEALTELQKALALPDDGSVNMRDIHGAIGSAYFELGLTEDALAAWSNGLIQYPGDAVLESDVALALVSLGSYTKALVHARSAAAAGVALPHVENTLGLIYLNQGDYRKAAEHFMKFQSYRPDDPMGYWNAALAYEKAGNYLRATEMVERFLSREQDPERRNRALSFLADMQTGGPALIR